MSKNKHIPFRIEIPESKDIESIMKRVQGYATDASHNSDERTITGKVPEEERAYLINYLEEEGWKHNLKSKKTFWKEEDQYGDMELRTVRIAAIITGVVAALLSVSMITTALQNYWWFESLGFEQVFMKNIVTNLSIFVVAFFVLIITGYLNWRGLKAKYHESAKRLKSVKGLYFLGMLTISFVLAYWISKDCWFKWLLYLNQTPFGQIDPIFGNDTSFYVFTIPFVSAVLFWVLIALIVLLITNFVIGMFIDEQDEYADIEDTLAKASPSGWKTILAMITFVIIGYFWIGRYNILFDEFGAISGGAGYTDIHIWLPAYYVAIAFLAIFGSILLKKAISKSSEKSSEKFASYVAIGVVGMIAILILTVIVSMACQSLVVNPNELAKESEYLGRNIEFTRNAYGIDTIDEKFYEGTAALNSSVLDSPSVKNVRILDYRPLIKTLEQQQALRLYYTMRDADVDRYYLNGSMTEVLVTARELNQEKLSSKTWVNEILIYTHGNGIVINPVNEVTREGLPILWVKNIPPQSTKLELDVDQPPIYYGELTHKYIITNTEQEEFDYPEGDENVYTTYDGCGGIQLSSTLRRAVLAWRLDLIKIWQSDYITPDSKVHLYRDISDRTSRIAPYLYYDNDPHIFVSNGTLSWMMSGMSHTDRYPYSEPSEMGQRMNYIRDSVKVVIDAKNGTANFYVIQEDPMIETYQKIYPGLFKPIDLMPEDHRKHAKYPEDMFTLQTEKLDVYHMTSVPVFYNKEDKWQIAKEIHGLDEEQNVEAYNVILELEDQTEFMLTLPLTPYGKQNMVAWFAVHQDPERYGEMVLYKWTKESVTYGPMQIESRISQDEEISAQMTLWNQEGTSVVRGNLLVIPVENSLLYVEPIYIVASIEGTMPELKKVVVAYHDPVDGEGKLAWDDTLEGAILKVVSADGPGTRAVIEEAKTTDTNGQEKTEIMVLIIYDENDQETTRIQLLQNQSVSLVPQ